MHWRVSSRLGLCKLISAQPLIWSPIMEFSIGSVLCCKNVNSFYQIDHNTLWWMLVGVNWLMLCQEYRSAVFWARYCSPVHFGAVFDTGK